MLDADSPSMLASYHRQTNERGRMMDDISIDHYVGLIKHQEQEIESLRAKLAEAEKDAERYRWIRNPKTDPALVIDKRTGERIDIHGNFDGFDYEYRAGEELDEAIDAAIAKQKGDQ